MALPAPTHPHARTEARRYLTQYHHERALPGLHDRLHQLDHDLHTHGTPTLTTDELTYGAQLAWRNSNKCIGRLYWPSLHVRDLRHIHHPDDIFTHLVEHLRHAWNGGHLRPTMSVFAPGVRLVNDQLIRYAGYRQPDGRIIGDPKNVPLTDFLHRHGWTGGPRTPFDVLPIAIQAHGRTHLYTLPPDAVHEVPITHPDAPRIAELGLRWHALPAISDLALSVAGLTYTCAPFNGWYMGTEIAARNLADTDRYNTLPAVARALGLDTRSERTLWRDRALVELNVAVLHSFDTHGVKIEDHHTATRRFVRFEHKEAQAGRAVTGRWSWLVPPLSPATTPVWHRTYTDTLVTPNFLPQAPAWSAELLRRCPFH
ncbi:nitric oxide synthase oxygenase [Deinococcus maricopensis]|uniref:Nitric oxide synthase oxygenase n=1 Tax=Deinococcus maricopensis (strain DSM 21211 / LMG 22137 / NRRL B-23946 / LB-34) TaxID=709986 RepID=E8U5K5_DEIML|nr:nitric oxide synthase oxygenase [Deinococcus maricopensis]ADV66344.1 Nitric-oxide synthase [Deinococcus maricopensis DSM 21211]